MGYAWLALILFFTDFFVKRNVEKSLPFHEEKKLLDDKIILRKHYNRGAVLNLFSESPKIVICVAQAVVTVLALIWVAFLKKKGNKGAKLGLTLLLAGGMNNLWDRLVKGYVVDYFSFNGLGGSLKNIVFNLSDMFIFIGGVLTVLFCKDKK